MRTSEVAVVLPSPAPSREAMLAQVSAGAHPVPGERVGALITQALVQGLPPPSTWATVCADLTLDTLRGITTTRP